MDTLTKHKLYLIHSGAGWGTVEIQVGHTACGAAFPFLIDWLKLPTGTSTGLQQSANRKIQWIPYSNLRAMTKAPNPFLYPALISTSHPEFHPHLGHSSNCGNSLFPWCFLLYLWFYPLPQASSTSSCLLPSLPFILTLPPQSPYN